jgi:hypothetical protein
MPTNDTSLLIRSRALATFALIFCLACESRPASAPSPAPAHPPAAAAPAAAQAAVAAPAAAPVVKLAVDPAPTQNIKPAVSANDSLYRGTHKLGVNRVTNMARVGRATFSERDGALYLQGRVARGAHWLELSGRVEIISPKKFLLSGTLRGIPDMSWANEAPRQRNTQGRMLFEMRHGRPYFRLYEIDGRECVCNDGCGNDFCYIDIEQAPLP